MYSCYTKVNSENKFIYSHERSHIYILLLFLNVVQAHTTITNTFMHITLAVICIM